MGKKRKGGKKREGALSSLKDAVSDEETGILGDDGVNGEVEQWERAEDDRLLSKVKFRGRKNEDSGPQEMFALSGTDSDSDLELPKLKKMKKSKSAKKNDQLNDSDIESGDDGEPQDGDIRKWGSKKKHYYGGNTGEEIEEGVDESDLEEDKMEELEAAKLQSRQLEMMEEEDFLDTFVPKTDEKSIAAPAATTVDAVTQDLSRLSAKERGKIFRQQNPEFDGVVADFNLRMKEATKLSKVLALAESGDLPSSACLDLVKYKLELLLNYCTNISAYFMFKSKGTSLTLHPVTTRLVQYRQLIDKVETIDKDAMQQIDNIVKRLDAGDSIKTLIKEEKRKLKRSKERKREGKIDFEAKKSKKKKKKTKKSSVQEEDEMNNHEDGLTIDEKMAVELYDVIKKKKVSDPLSDEEGNEEEESDENTESNNVEVADDLNIESNTYNNQNEDLEDDDIDEKRAITYKIAKNKGLTPKRSKLQRNPRVKNRVKYQKAMKRRKGAVREVRDQNTKYGGEASGINMRVKKGVKFN